METDEAPEAIHTEEAAAPEGAANETLETLLEQMAGTQAEPAAEAPELPAAEQAAATADEKKAKNFRGRWDHLDEAERRVVELTTRRGLTLAEAYRAVYGEAGAASPAGEAPEAFDEAIATQEAQVAELKRRKAEARGDLQEYDAAAEAYLEAREALQALRQERQSAAGREAERARLAEAAAQEAIEEEYPEALAPGTELAEAYREEMAYLRESGSPLLNDPRAPYKVVRRLARVLGVADRAGKAEAHLPRRTVRPVPVGGLPVEAPMATLERRVSDAKSPGAMLDLMREIGTPFEALLKRG